MKWIHYLSNSKTQFNIYTLKAGDSVIRINQLYNNNKLIILHGTLYIIKIFTNGEISLINIINQNCIIDIKDDILYKSSYYKIIALEKTYLLSLPLIELIYEKQNNRNLYINLIYSYQNTLKNYQAINIILKHIHIKNRIIQLFIFLFIEFGNITQNNIKIPFYITKNDIAIMVGTNLSTINKIIKNLENHNIIQYSNQRSLILNHKLIYSLIILLS